MIDYLKIHSLPVDADKIIQHQLLTFPLSNVATTGEILNRWQVAHWRNLRFKVKNEHVKMEGSLHKYAKDGINYDNFSIQEIKNAIEEIATTFKFDPSQARINFLEIGINIQTENDPSDIINTFLLYKTMPFKDICVKSNGIGRMCEMQQFTIKVYNKSLKELLPYQLLRYELKISKMEFLKKFGCKELTLSDLVMPETYSKFKDILLLVLDNIVISNPNIEPEDFLNQKEHDLVITGKYYEYWQNLPRQRRHEQISKFIELAGGNEIRNHLKEMISQKWQDLIPDKITTFQNKKLNGKPDKITTFTTDYVDTKNIKNGQNNLTINGYLRTCPITGVSITMQKSGSRLLSNTGLKWLKENDPKTFEIIKRRFLPRSGYSGLHTKFERNEFYHLSKQIRNTYYKKISRNKIPVNQLALY